MYKHKNTYFDNEFLLRIVIIFHFQKMPDFTSSLLFKILTNFYNKIKKKSTIRTAKHK